MNKDSQPKNTPEQLDENVEDKSIIANFFIFVVLMALFWGLVGFFTRKKRKKELYKKYGVTGKTFKKWIEYFCRDVITIDTWKDKRLFTREEFKAIQECLGNPNPKKNYSKKELLKEFNITKYEYLKWGIIDSIDESKKPFITEEIYKSLNKFPPKAKDEMAIIINENEV